MIPRTICLHGPESSGKSTLAPRLAARFGGAVLGEYGRDFAEMRGIDFGMDDLVEIARTHDSRAKALLAAGADPLILDTDALMTEAWAEMLFSRHDPWFDGWHDTADLYLLFDIDIPWIADGTRLFGTAKRRQRFFDISKQVLEWRGVPWVLISGEGEARFEAAITAIETFNPGSARSC